MAAFEDFQQNLLDVHIPLFLQRMHDGEIKFDLRTGQNPMTSAPFRRRDDIFLDRLMDSFVEIHDSYERLRDVELYAGRFPFSRTRVDKVRFLRFAVEAWLHELYMLRERLYAFTTTLQRAYRKDARAQRVAFAAESMRQMARHALDGVTRARDSHVHESRFTDIEIRQLSLLRILALREPQQAWLFEAVYIETRRKKREWLQRNNDAVEQVLNEYFGIALPLVFTPSGKLSPPNAA
jgi:hypothetical protein